MLKKELNRLEVSLDTPYKQQAIALEKGQYVLRLIHQNDAIFKRLRSLFFSFAIDGKSPEEVKGILGLRDISDQFGAFAYVGAGYEESGYFVKELTLNVKQDISSLNVELRTFLPISDILIEAFQIYDSSITEEELFGVKLKSLNRLFFDNSDLNGSIDNYINRREWERIQFLLCVDTDKDDLEKIVNDLNNLNKSLDADSNILVYLINSVDIQVIDESIVDISSIELFSPFMLGAELDLSEKYTFNILRKIEHYLPNIKYCGISSSQFLEGIRSEGIFSKKIYMYDKDHLQGFISEIKNDNQSNEDEDIHIQKYESVIIDDFKKIIKVSEQGMLKVSFEIFNKENTVFDSSALVIVNYVSKREGFILPPDNLGINPNFGAYKYIVSGTIENPGLNELELIIPHEDITEIELTFKSWGKKRVESYLNLSTFEVSSHKSVRGVSNQELFLENLNSNDKIILIYTTAPYIGHETLELRPNRLTKEYIKLGYKVIFFAFSRVPEELEYPDEYNGSLLQCHKDDLLKYISLISNKKLVEKLFICSSFPDIFALAAITRLKLFNDWKLTYEIRDDMEEFNRVGYSKWYSTQLEVKVARLVDRIMTVSPRLAKKIKIMSKHMDDWADKVRVIQNAAPDSLIDKSTYLRSPNFFQQKTESKIVGYIGHLTPAWFDWTLILTAARDFPDLTFEIIGHGMPETLTLPENVVYLGPKSHDEFLEISERWKVGLIPFITSPLTYGVDPNKIYEYLAANLLVVTADMGSVRECPATYVYTNYPEFKIGLESALKIKYTSKLLSEIIDYVEKSHWSNRAQKMIEFIQEEI